MEKVYYINTCPTLTWLDQSAPLPAFLLNTAIKKVYRNPKKYNKLVFLTLLSKVSQSEKQMILHIYEQYSALSRQILPSGVFRRLRNPPPHYEPATILSYGVQNAYYDSYSYVYLDRDTILKGSFTKYYSLSFKLY
jgi:hypothetical protein